MKCGLAGVVWCMLCTVPGGYVDLRHVSGESGAKLFSFAASLCASATTTTDHIYTPARRGSCETRRAPGRGCSVINDVQKRPALRKCNNVNNYYIAAASSFLSPPRLRHSRASHDRRTFSPAETQLKVYTHTLTLEIYHLVHAHNCTTEGLILNFILISSLPFCPAPSPFPPSPSLPSFPPPPGESLHADV